MDDFGVESSNLALLSLVKFDILKIDKGFVKDIISNKRAQIIIGMMTRMCSEMGIQLVAEGIEAVSYTHLDVYKRQVQLNIIIPLLFALLFMKCCGEGGVHMINPFIDNVAAG